MQYDIQQIFTDFGLWAWNLLTGLYDAVKWLFSTNETLSTAINLVLNTVFNPETPYDLSIAPIYLIGGGAFVFVLIAGILRAIL